MLMVGFVPISKEDAERTSRPFRKLSFASRRGISTIPEGDIKFKAQMAKILKLSHFDIPWVFGF